MNSWRVTAMNGEVVAVEQCSRHPDNPRSFMFGRRGTLRTYTRPSQLPAGETNFYCNAVDELGAFNLWTQWMQYGDAS